jgi:DNA-binding response OmpR family regulator
MILLDLKLPKVNGLVILEKLKQDERTKMVPVIILTSSRQEDDIRKGYDLNVNSYIVKPVDFDDYVETVRQVGEYWLFTNESPY